MGSLLLSVLLLSLVTGLLASATLWGLLLLGVALLLTGTTPAAAAPATPALLATTGLTALFSTVLTLVTLSLLLIRLGTLLIPLLISLPLWAATATATAVR